MRIARIRITTALTQSQRRIECALHSIINEFLCSLARAGALASYRSTRLGRHGHGDAAEEEEQCLWLGQRGYTRCMGCPEQARLCKEEQRHLPESV